MEIDELEDVLDSSIITLLKSFGFRKGIRVPVVVINDWDKFLQFILREKREVSIIASKDRIETLAPIVRKVARSYYLLVDDNLKDYVLLFYK